jgi:H2-forming N5,N10-methylenetetrahydromethanopterin dehydrogenase-like enzyme
MSQSKKGSLIEAMSSLLVGMVISALLNYYVLPLIGVPVSGSQNVMMIILFTSTSFVRSYGMRRLFNWIHSKFNF